VLERRQRRGRSTGVKTRSRLAVEVDWDRVLWQRMGKFMFYSLEYVLARSLLLIPCGDTVIDAGFCTCTC